MHVNQDEVISQIRGSSNICYFGGTGHAQLLECHVGAIRMGLE